MKKSIKHLVSAMAVSLFIFFAVGSDDDETTESSISNGENSKSNSYSTPKSTPSSSINGTYSSSVSGGGSGGKFTVSIYGESWNSVLKINSYDNGSYERGLVRGKDLYDESGFVKLGYVSGNRVTMGQFSATK
jgi:hypothetical protein|tara:strand:- start:2119 stop:2517 length:399 start_codon:yes stop_codon:yes gene_type:complete